MNKFTPEQIEDIKSTKMKIGNAIRTKLLDPLVTNELHDLILNNCVLSGGAIASVFLKEKINDFDLYFKSKEAMDTFNKLMQHKHNQTIIKDGDAKYGAGTKLITPRATTLINDIQIITMQLSSDRNATFDFVHCRPYYDLKDDALFISPKEYKCIVTKHLVVNCAETLTDKRIEKYKARGWTL